MPRYKLRVPEAGTFLVGDGPGDSVVAESVDEARELLEEFEVHSQIGWCHVLYKDDIENDHCFEGAEPGDTQVEFIRDDGRDLRDNECRVWMTGPPPLRDWKLEPLGYEEIKLKDLPAGTLLSFRKGSNDYWRVVEPAQDRGGYWALQVETKDGEPLPECRFVKDDAVTVYLAPYFGNFSPSLRYRLTVHGEVAEGSEEEMNALLRWVEAEMADQWRRDLYAKEAVT